MSGDLRSKDPSRRTFLAFLAALGAGAPVLARAAEAAGGGEVTLETLAAAERIAGVEFTDEERELMLEGVRDLSEDYRALRQVELPNSVSPALVFDPLLPRMEVDESRPPVASEPSRQDGFEVDAGSEEELAFLPVHRLAELVRGGEITSERLTGLYLDRLKRLGPKLECVITLTEERALEQARRADAEIRAGRYRGPLHGIPWGAKDLLSVSGYPTTWGATPFRQQRLEHDAAVVRRLDAAGAVLVAKLTLGALAWGDVWYGGKTRNPWNLEEGSSGSSAGSASATAGGLVAFSIGSETWGSIVSPSTRCGATGLRPTFGRISRDGAMALSWSMDKLGPICRSVEDCALVLEAIHGTLPAELPGPGESDPSVVDRSFAWDSRREFRNLRVGYLKSEFESDPTEGAETPEQAAEAEEARRFELRTLDTLRALGFELVPLELPSLPINALSLILNAEAAAAFDALTRSNRDDELVRQVAVAWPNFFRMARTIPAVEYVQANRVRTLAMAQLDAALQGVDVYVAPSFSDNLLLTNLTGHPAVTLPNGFRGDGRPTSITFCGKLFGEEKLLLLAMAYQHASGFHRRHPQL
ncbi:MAG: amidase [Acidobacteriota bacterium]|nr:amidase [Acidobacteriota bacterium]